MRVQMLGLCRFSYLGGRGFQVAHDSLAARRAFLYDPKRLARRWFWFENVALPAWLAQKDPDFTLVVMTGPDLPEPWLSRLRGLVGVMPQLRLELVAPMEKHIDACMAAVAPHIDASADVVGHFRHDDDDAVAVDFIQDARRDFERIAPLWRQHGRLSCDYARGAVLRGAGAGQGGGIAAEMRIVHNASAALVIFLPPDAGRCVLHFPHFKVNQSMPGVTLAAKPMFVRMLHGDNDSGAVGAGYAVEGPAQDMAALLTRRFRIDLAGLTAGAAALP